MFTAGSDYLPQEMNALIFSFLTPGRRALCRLVCGGWRDCLAVDEASAWALADLAAPDEPLECLEWMLRSDNVAVYWEALEASAYHGRFDAVQLLYRAAVERYGARDADEMVYKAEVAQHAAWWNRTDVLGWVTELADQTQFAVPDDPDEEDCGELRVPDFFFGGWAAACEAGHLGVVKWWYESFPDALDAEPAAAHGHVHILRWLAAQKVASVFVADTVMAAVLNLQLEAAQFLFGLEGRDWYGWYEEHMHRMVCDRVQGLLTDKGVPQTPLQPLGPLVAEHLPEWREMWDCVVEW